MKKLAVLITAVLGIAMIAGCAGSGDNNASPSASATTTATASAEATPSATTASKIKVGASPAPHAEILEQVKTELAKEGIEMEIVEFTDYVIPNTSLNEGELDANFFQHQPYLDDFNDERGTKLVSIAKIHYEPMGIYAGKLSKLEDLKDGGTIAVPNDPTNEARALQLLQEAGLITLKKDAGLKATINDIETNEKNLKITELEAAQIPNSLKDVDFGVINGNYAIGAGLKASDALLAEKPESEAAKTMANVLVVQEGKEDDPTLKKLAEVMQSETIKKFIEDKYEGSVVPVF